MIVFFLAGSFEFLAADYLQTSGFKPFEGQNVVICGSVASEPEVKEERVTYTVKVQRIRRGKDGEPAGMGGKLLLSTIKNTDRGFFDYGRELTFEGELTLPRGVRNPGGFDYRRYLAQKGVGALMFTYPYAIEAGGRQGNFLVEAGLSIRKRIVTVIEKSLPRQQAGLLNGMLIGYREGLSEDVQDAFSNAGLTHIMAVSGANVAFLLLPLAYLFKLLRFHRTPANLMMIAFLVFFIFITGFEPSVLRAVLMAVILLISAILYREPDTYTSIALSCILLLAVSPCMLFNAGFQLSYAATLSIVMLYKNINKLVSWPFIPALVTETFSATMAAQLGVLPITLVCFNKVSLIAILSNLLAVPMLEIITILGTLMAILGQISLVLSQLLGYLNALLLSAVLYIVKFSSSVPFAVLNRNTARFACRRLLYLRLVPALVQTA
jgi:competence protein ComEC